MSGPLLRCRADSFFELPDMALTMGGEEDNPLTSIDLPERRMCRESVAQRKLRRLDEAGDDVPLLAKRLRRGTLLLAAASRDQAFRGGNAPSTRCSVRDTRE